MKSIFAKGLPLFIITSFLIPLTEIAVKAQPNSHQINIAQRREKTKAKLFQGNTAPLVVNAGTANAAADHFLEVEVKGEPLDRLKVVCVTFHELKGVKVIDANSGQPIPHSIEYGFEEFTITFNQPVAIGTKVRTVIEGSTVRGVNAGIIVPYRVFSVSSTLGEIPIGTAVVRTPDYD